MIAVDTSALMAVVLKEPAFDACRRAIAAEDDVLLSAGTAAEAFIVAQGRNVSRQMNDLLERVTFQIVPVTQAPARRVAAAYARWGKGFHPARLNFGDCFSYEVAKLHNCPLLFVGNDFSQTDIVSAL